MAINVSVCLVDRPEVCGPPTRARICEWDFVLALFGGGWLAWLGSADWLSGWLMDPSSG